MQSIISILLLLIANISFGQNWIDTTFTTSSEFDIVYGTATTFAGTTDTLKLDISYPENDMPLSCGRPLIVIIHGGGWIAGDKNEGYPKSLRQDFAKRGYVAASINYRLGQFNTNQAINCNVPGWNCFNMTDSSEYYRANHRAIQDAKGSIRYLINNAGTYQIDPNNVFVVGESAGGFVAMGVGFIDNDTEVMTDLIEEYADAPAPNILYESTCVQTLGFANDIASMDLSRPALGSYVGTLNFPLSKEYKIKAVGNIYGGAFNNIFQSFSDSAPQLYLYHQPCDLIVPFNYQKVLSGFNYCLSQFPTFCGNIVNRPFVYGSKGITALIDTMAAEGFPTSEYFFDQSTNNYNCLQQFDANLACHAIDNYWLRTTNMATYFAGLIDACIPTNTSSADIPQEDFVKAIYPNPANSIITVELNKKIERLNISVINVLGQIENASQISNRLEVELKLNHLPNGIYYLQISSQDQSEILPFLKIM